MRSKLLWGVALSAVALGLEAGCSASVHGDATDAGGAPGSAGSGGASGASGGAVGQGGAAGIDAGLDSDDRLFVPEGLPNTNQNGQDVGLVLIAFTLVPGATGPSFYAAVQNVWPTPLCEPGMMIAFYDRGGQLMGTAASVLQTGRFYQVNDGSGAIIPCVDPGQIAMTGETDLPDTIAIEELGSLQHLFPTFNLDVTPVGGLTVTGVEAAAGGQGPAYAGTARQRPRLDALSGASVAIFPVNRVGRPLGMATASATADLAPGETWTFQTDAVDDPGVDQVAYATGSVP